MIKYFYFRNYINDEHSIIIRSPEQSGFLISSVTGLDMPKGGISTYEYSMIDGSMISNTRVEPRNVVFNLLYYPYNILGRTIEELRYWCHRYFPVGKPIHFSTWKEDNTGYVLNGYVESNETNIFSKMEGSQISILCPDPYFIKVDSLQTIPIYYPRVNVYYEGQGECGLLIEINATGTAGEIRVSNTTRGEQIVIQTWKFESLTGSPLASGDKLLINTSTGNKYATLVRGTNSYNVMDAVYTASKWPYLQHGNNDITFTALSGLDNLTANITFETKLLGI